MHLDLERPRDGVQRRRVPLAEDEVVDVRGAGERVDANGACIRPSDDKDQRDDDKMEEVRVESAAVDSRPRVAQAVHRAGRHAQTVLPE